MVLVTSGDFVLGVYEAPTRGAMKLIEILFPEDWADLTGKTKLRAILMSASDVDLASSKPVEVFVGRGICFKTIFSLKTRVSLQGDFMSGAPVASFTTTHIKMGECTCPFNDPKVRESYMQRSGWKHKVAENWTFDCTDYDKQIQRDLAPWHSYNAGKINQASFDWAYQLTKSAYLFGLPPLRPSRINSTHRILRQ